MSDYSKITNFLSKDSLALNDPAKYVKGSEIDAEYNAIAVAIATKADTASPTLTTPTMSSPTITGTITAAIANFSGLVTAALGLTVSGAAFNSRGITDNATAKALTLSGSGANSVTIANSAGNPTIGSSAGALSFNPVGQGEALRVTTGGASTVNYWSLSGALTGSRLTLLATGSDANVGASWQTKGSGSHLFVTETGASAQVEITHTASANQYVTLTGGVSNGVSISAAGAANPNIYMFSGGTGIMAFGTGSATNEQVRINHTASADRYITLTGSNGGNPTIGTSGGDLKLTANTNTINVLGALVSTLQVYANNQTATPAGGAVNTGVFLGSAGIGIFFGSGAPTVSAVKGSIYLRSNGSTTNDRMYINTDGNTTWTAVTTAA